MLQTDRTDTGRLIDSKMVTDIPTTFNRNFQSLLNRSLHSMIEALNRLFDLA